MKISEIKTSRSLLALAGASILTTGGCCQVVVNSPVAEHRTEKMVVILPGVIEGQSWNKMNYEGILKCRETLGVDLEFVRNATENDFEAALTEYGNQDYGLVTAVGSQLDDAVSMVVPRFPDTTFCVISGPLCQGRDVTPIFPKEYEASYLASIIVGSITRSGMLGIIADYPSAPVEHLLDVHEKNAMGTISQREIGNPQTLRSYANSQSNVDPGKKIVKRMIDNGADILFIYANEAGFGYIWAARERQVRVIGFSDSQNDLEPGTVITSVYFDFSTFYRWAIEQYMNGGLQGNKVHEIGIRERIFVPVFLEGAPEDLRDAIDQGTSNFLKGKVDLT